MPVEEDRDYVFCPAATYIGSVGVGKGCLVGTRTLLLGLPVEIQEAEWNRSFTTTTWTIAGLSPPDAIRHIAAASSTDLPTFEALCSGLGQEVQGAVFVDLAEQKRLKVRAGLCTKGIYWSTRTSGPGWQGYGLGDKDLCQRWIGVRYVDVVCRARHGHEQQATANDKTMPASKSCMVRCVSRIATMHQSPHERVRRSQRTGVLKPAASPGRGDNHVASNRCHVEARPIPHRPCRCEEGPRDFSLGDVT